MLQRNPWDAHKLVAYTPNEFHLIVYDPGGTIGWARFVLDCHAFSRPEHKVLGNLISWDCGEFSGPEDTQLRDAVNLIHQSRRPMPFTPHTIVLSEDFALAQLIGGKNLLSPVRINAVLDWECRKRGLQLELQDRSQRTQITPDRLLEFGFEPPGRKRWSPNGPGKDAFAAMQHGIVKLRRLKEASRSRPWKLSDATSSNALWDCACHFGKRCDLTHP